ncbi:MAG: hypothetical protein HQM10_07285 [Candidatus Riflebacteria bacterium]|nr:hypothetical protein [Candidatus Riflebacteria bacterium]
MKLRFYFFFMVVCLSACYLFPARTNAGKADFKVDYESKTITESTYRNYGELFYPNATGTWNTKKLEYDKSFAGSENKFDLRLKYDFSESNYIDFHENVNVQAFKSEDYYSFSTDTRKYRLTDHFFSAKFGQAIGSRDVLEIAWLNNIYRLPLDNWYDFDSNIGKASFNHRINNNSGIIAEGGYEERLFPNDRSLDYQEGAFILNIFTLVPEKFNYRPVGSSVRGNRSTFRKTPTGMNTGKAVDYYTNWSRNPNDLDEKAKYLAEPIHGDISLRLTSDVRTRKRTQIDNGYYQPSLTFSGNYQINFQTDLILEDTWYQRKHSRESEQHYLFDHSFNRFTLGLTNSPRKRILHSCVFSNEQYGHVNRKEQDFRINSLTWESDYFQDSTGINLFLKESQIRYGFPRIFYSDSDHFYAALDFFYLLTDSFIFHLKTEWNDWDFLDYENLFYSSRVEHLWKTSLEKRLDKYNSLELGYQDNKEIHSLYEVNDIIEKTLFFSWNALY